ncbi:hypothetical protein [Agreia sp. Leaf244]|uniref:hypothetical protein n=1 Tax=Agreia sp. Leaf244 TaxID=1736305 RepID=UPI000AF4674A|nr:hypothetical protein [Agreia sp. Leaf244]
MTRIRFHALWAKSIARIKEDSLMVIGRYPRAGVIAELSHPSPASAHAPLR